jgi:hypothetical protein
MFYKENGLHGPRYCGIHIQNCPVISRKKLAQNRVMDINSCITDYIPIIHSFSNLAFKPSLGIHVNCE